MVSRAFKFWTTSFAAVSSSSNSMVSSKPKGSRESLAGCL